MPPPPLRKPLGYSPHDLLGDRPHVMVDGAARPSSVLTLSHWPQSPTPPAFAHDLSAGIVLSYLRQTTAGGASGGDAALAAALARGESAEAVTNDHFDEDGLMSVWSLMSPETALELADLVVDVASCGDFGVVKDYMSAEVAFAIAPLAELEAGAAASTADRYLATLPRVEELLRHPERYREHWAEEVDELDAGRRALAAGDVTIENLQAIDLAVVARGEPGAGVGVPARRLAGAAGGLPVHAAVAHSATSASRILAFDGAYCECYLRYEGWVKVVSRAVPLRPDLAPLAEELSALEPGGVTWEANPVGAIIGRLMPGGDGRSDLAPYVIRGAVESYLATAPPAWDPFRPGGGYIPSGERDAYRRGGRTGRRARNPQQDDERQGPGRGTGNGRLPRPGPRSVRRPVGPRRKRR
ncbi:MAG: DUF6687 family protein [Acidimicrobiales bacterium]